GRGQQRPDELLVQGTSLVSGSADFSRQLATQLEFLETSCQAYDAGNHGEAASIAASLDEIFQHATNSLSILARLGASSTNVLSTAGNRPDSSATGFWPALIQIGCDLHTNVFSCAPTLGTRSSVHRMIPATAWWDGEVVFVSPGKRLKRKQLVLCAAKKD